MSDLVHLSGRTNLAHLAGTTNVVDLHLERVRREREAAAVSGAQLRRRPARPRVAVRDVHARTVLGRDGPDAA